MSSHRFLNPYNFVRYLPQGKEKDTPENKLLGKCAPPPHDRFIGLTGRIECELKAVTPIFVSDPEEVHVNDKVKEHKSYRFFRLNENGQEYFAIPSTTLRGTLRSVFEAATNSCFSIFEGGLLGKRERPEEYDETPLIAGLIIEIPKSENKLGRVKQMKAYRLPHNRFPRYTNNFRMNGKKVLVKIDNNEVSEVKEYNAKEKNTGGYLEGYLKTSDKGIPGSTQKRNECVFVDDNSSTYFELSYETYQNYVIANRNNRHEHTKYPRPGDTIWFRVGKNRKKINEFGYAQIYRKPFSKSIGDLLPKEFHPCSDYNELCPACRVFGWVHQNPSKELEMKVSYAGRIRISHAKIVENKDHQKEFPCAILSTPKPTTTYFYLFEKGKPKLSVTYDTPGAQLRGRKFYRHQTEAKEQEYIRTDNIIIDKQNRTIRDALNPGAKFQFTIEFENLAPVELGALLWSIEMEDEMHHKLGLAKPLGFGSVKISIENISILNIKERYASYSNTEWKKITNQKIKECKNSFKQAMENKYNKTFEELENVKDLKAILSAPSSGLTVHYPRTSEKPGVEGRNFQWFVKNKKQGIPLKIASEDNEGLPS
ncbi:MAG: TIGR03986 family CRISPR-associated RAMP protein [Candidatus Freyarchaeum deiterrae]